MRVIDIDLRSYFDNIRHDRLLAKVVAAKVAKRVDDVDVMHFLTIMLKASGGRGLSFRKAMSSPHCSVRPTSLMWTRMLERAKEATRYGKYTGIEYARFADDLVILIDATGDMIGFCRRLRNG